jgi:hypothetical protein
MPGYTKNQLEKMERQYQKERHERLQRHYNEALEREALEREELERRNNGYAQVPHSEEDNQELSSDSQGPIVDSQEPSGDSQEPIVDSQEPSGDSQETSKEPRRKRNMRQRIDNGDGTFSYVQSPPGGSKKKRQSKRTKRTRRSKKNKRTTKKR